MARPGLTYEEFEHLARAIEAAGKQVTYKAVESAVEKASDGTPSRSTLQKHFKTWNARNDADSSMPVEIPKEVEETFRAMLTKLWQTSQSTAYQDVETIRRAANGRAETLERQLQEVCQLSDETAEHLSKTAEALDLANNRIRSLEQELARCAGEKTVLEKQLGEQSEMLKVQADNFERWMGQSKVPSKSAVKSRTRSQKGTDDTQE